MHGCAGGSSLPPPVDLRPHFPYLSRDGVSEQEFSHHLHNMLNDQTEEIQRQFSTLALSLQKDIEKTSNSVADVITLLIYNKNDFEKLLNDCQSFSDVFRKIHKYVSFFDFGLIKLLAHNFGSTAFKKKLKKYKQKFQKYAERRVCECPNDAFGKVGGAEKVYKLKIGEDFETLTMKELEKLEHEMNKILGHTFLRLLNIKEGCVELVFRGLEESNFTITEEQRESLSKLGVLTISYGDETIIINSSMPAKVVVNSEKIDGELSRYRHSFTCSTFITIEHESDSGYLTRETLTTSSKCEMV